jgi:hypothetical protein
MAKGPAGLGTQASAPGQRWPLRSIKASERARTLPGHRPFSFFFFSAFFSLSFAHTLGSFGLIKLARIGIPFVDYLFFFF